MLLPRQTQLTEPHHLQQPTEHNPSQVQKKFQSVGSTGPVEAKDVEVRAADKGGATQHKRRNEKRPAQIKQPDHLPC